MIAPPQIRTLAQRPDWAHDAPCQRLHHIFFGPNATSTRRAKAICDTCPHEAECLEYALEINVSDGVWGGTTARERRAIRRERKGQRPRRTEIEHGTYAGYYWHRRKGTEICASCRSAYTAYRTQYRRRLRVEVAS